MLVGRNQAIPAKDPKTTGHSKERRSSTEMQTTLLLLLVTVVGRNNVFPTKNQKLQVNTRQKSKWMRNADSIVVVGVGVVDDGGGNGATAAGRKTC